MSLIEAKDILSSNDRTETLEYLVVLRDLAEVNKQWGELVEYFFLSEEVIKRTSQKLTDDILVKEWRSKETEVCLDLLYESFKGLMEKAFLHHHSFKFIKNLTDITLRVYTYDSAAKKEAEMSKGREKYTTIFQLIVQGFTICIFLLLDLKEKDIIQVVLDKFDFGYTTLTEPEIVDKIHFSKRWIYDTMSIYKTGLYETYRGIVQEVLNHSRQILEYSRNLISEEHYHLDKVTDSKLQDLLRDLKHFVTCCELSTFQKCLHPATNKPL